MSGKRKTEGARRIWDKYKFVALVALAAVIVSSGFRRPPAPKLFLAYAARIYQLGYPSIFMQMLFTVYIMALNLILAGFSDAAVTVSNDDKCREREILTALYNLGYTIELDELLNSSVFDFSVFCPIHTIS